MSGIEWTDVTWNPVTGCSKVSPGCDECYMFAQYPRLKAMGVRGYEEQPDAVKLLPERLAQPYRWRKPRRVFVCSMADLFHRDVPFDFIAQVFATMALNKHHTFQVLTKRPGRAAAFHEDRILTWGESWQWPKNVWIGTSVEMQKYAPRIDVIDRIPAAVRFVSMEPLLELVDISHYLWAGKLDWVIVGGESGPRARRMDPYWAEWIVKDCNNIGIPVFFKQFGGRRGKRGGNDAILLGQVWHQFPYVPREL